MGRLATWQAQRQVLPPKAPVVEAEFDRIEREAVRTLEQFSANAVRRGMAALDAEHAAVVAATRTVRYAMEALTEQAEQGDISAAEAGKAWARLHREREQLTQRAAGLHARLEALREPAENPIDYADDTLAKYRLGPFLPPLT